MRPEDVERVDDPVDDPVVDDSVDADPVPVVPESVDVTPVKNIKLCRFLKLFHYRCGW